ncbi:MAG: response regulator transcription factor [Bacteroidia bacterium]|nr:MAG: response regulator transcription factor [Bacteroidia bacterium]
MKILVCEDNKLASLAISTVLKRRGYTIDVATDGNVAMEKIAQGNLDLVIMDIHLPYHSGLELVRYMRIDLELKIPVIIVSAFSDKQVQKQARELGISEYLVKPFDIDTLIERIETLLSSSK